MEKIKRGREIMCQKDAMQHIREEIRERVYEQKMCTSTSAENV